MADLAGFGTTEMIGYHAYLIGSDGHIQQRIDLLCDTDEEAKGQVEQLVDGHDVELWHLNRRVCEFKAKE
ncbi:MULTISPECIES: hypothetical protein [Bradyrhizobium]|uniref:hypothetical protein n=1 Tax=Bradyrhizobium TaxID=374 RepID=UPI0024AF0BE1|nr:MULTISPECIES: hypothetical protein [Bradyrhizobium]WFT91895.1 hypothetical protein QA633_26470 [Bradyrhizobium barranii]WLB58161.1 hypothetical protein QIH94_19915 [Bradyrhizobium japonicum]